MASNLLSSTPTTGTTTFGLLTPTLGYVSYLPENPPGSQGDPNSIVIQPGGIGNQTYILLGQNLQNQSVNAFIQTITLKNSGTKASDPNAAITIATSNSPFIQLNYVWNDVDNDNILDNGETVVYANGQSSVNFTPGSVAAGGQVNLKAASKIVNADNTLTTQKLTFQLQSNPNSAINLGDATGEITLYLTQTGFSKTSGSDEFAFTQLQDSILTITGSSLAPNSKPYTQSASVPRAFGPLTEGPGSPNPGQLHYLALSNFKGAADGFGAADDWTLWSDPITGSGSQSFQVVWGVPPGANFTPFINNGNVSGSNSAFNNNNGIANDSLIELFNSGYFSQAFAGPNITKDGQSLNAALKGNRGSQSINQTAAIGNIGSSALQQSTVPSNFRGSFDQFISRSLTSPANAIWQVNFSDPSIGRNNNPLAWSNYNPFTNPKIASIRVAAGFPATSQFYINMGNGDGNLDLSRTGFFLANGTRISVNMDGGNGKDTLRGTSGNDTLTGGNGKDIFIFGINSGTDTVTDFKTSGNSNNLDQLDLTELGINASNVLTRLDARSSGGNGNGVIDAGDRGVTLVNSGSTQSLKLDLSFFSDRAAGLSPNPNGPFNTNTTIILQGVTSLRPGFFV